MTGNFPKEIEQINNSRDGTKTFENICIIGLGTIGGFLAKDLSELETTKKLTLFDYDTVEIENLKNSIYKEEDVGRLKTMAIQNKLNPKINVITRNESFKEEETKIPKHDLVIDCRDFTYDRKNIIDVRLHISLKTLIIDCRKNIKNDYHYEGKYRERLNKIDLMNASLNTTLLIRKKIIEEFIERQIVHRVYLNHPYEMATKVIEQSRNKQDIIYDSQSYDKKFLNLHEGYPSIIKGNKTKNITIYLGEKNCPSFNKTYPINEFKNLNELYVTFSNLVNKWPHPYNSYFVSLTNVDDEFYIEILPEIGSA